MTIVGVVGDVRQRNPAIAPMPECYMPYRQHIYNNNTLNVVIRTAGDPTALAGTGAARRGGDLAGGAGLVHDDGSDGVEARGRPEIPRAVVRAVCRARRVSGHGRRLWRDGVCRRTAIEGDRPADGARRQHELRAAADSRTGARPRGRRIGRRPGRRGCGHTAAADRAVRGAADRHPGVSGSGRPARPS